MSRKQQAADMLIDGATVRAVVASTGLQTSTVRAMRRRLARPIEGDPQDRGCGVIRCRLCGLPTRDHTIGPCPAGSSR